ncbi:MAG TPA: ABC transporter permease [Ktedonobacterales bacterium]|jgi:ABC-type sulfate transport system permease component|nr:ABC transporter permease [Ktedonobacterales bacterium]
MMTSGSGPSIQIPRDSHASAWRRAEPGAITLWLLSALALIYLVAPLIELLLAEPWSSVPAALADPQAQAAARVSAVAATITTALVALGGIPLAYALARWRFPLRSFVTWVLFVPLVFPAVVSGIAQLLVYGPYGPVGLFFAAHGVELTDSLAGVVLAQSFVAAPFAVVAARSAFEAVNPLTESVAQTLGASRWRIFWTISLPQAWGGALAGLALTWLRAFGEFGATTVLAYHPYTLPVYVYVQLTGLGTPAALPLALVALAVCAVVITIALLLTRRLPQSGGQP